MNEKRLLLRIKTMIVADDRAFKRHLNTHDAIFHCILLFSLYQLIVHWKLIGTAQDIIKSLKCHFWR